MNIAHNSVTIHNITFSNCRFDDNQWARASEGASAAPLASRPVVATAASPIAPIVAAPEVGTGGFRSATVMGTPVVIPDDDYGKQLGTQREIAAAKKKVGQASGTITGGGIRRRGKMPCPELDGPPVEDSAVRRAPKRAKPDVPAAGRHNFQFSLQRWSCHSLHGS